MELVGLYNSVSSGMKMSLSAMDILSVLSQGYALMTSGADFVEYRIPQDGTYSYGRSALPPCWTSAGRPTAPAFTRCWITSRNTQGAKPC